MEVAEALSNGRFVAHDGPIDEQGWERIVMALPSAAAVGVRLRGCGLTCLHAVQLAEALASNSTLEVLELPDNKIEESGAKALVQMLKLSNTTLKSVDLSGNPCSDTATETLQDLETLMRRNRVIKKLPKTPPRVPSSSGGGGASSGGAPGQTGVPLSGAAFEIERRLQHLEEAESTIRSELEHVRSFSTQSESWQKKIDTAGQQIAAILSLVDSRNMALEARLLSMERWRQVAEQAWADQSKVVEELANQLLALQARVQALERRLPPGAGSGSISGTPATAFATSAASMPAADALWQELQTMGERLLRLEGAVGTGLGRSASIRALLQDRAVGASSGSAVITVIEEPQETTKAGASEPSGKQAAAEAGGPLAALHGEISFGRPSGLSASPSARSLDGSSPRAGRPPAPGVPAAGGVDSSCSSPSGLTPYVERSQSCTAGTASVAQAREPDAPASGVDATPKVWGEEEEEEDGCMDAEDTEADEVQEMGPGSGALPARRGAGAPRLEVPGSPIMWHTNTWAASPSSAGNTPSANDPLPTRIFLRDSDRISGGSLGGEVGRAGGSQIPRAMGSSSQGRAVTAVAVGSAHGGSAGAMPPRAPSSAAVAASITAVEDPEDCTPLMASTAVAASAAGAFLSGATAAAAAAAQPAASLTSTTPSSLRPLAAAGGATPGSKGSVRLYGAGNRVSDAGLGGASPGLARYGLDPQDSGDTPPSSPPGASRRRQGGGSPFAATSGAAAAAAAVGATVGTPPMLSKESSKSSPPFESTFSVDAEKLSLSAAVASGSACPRTPAAATTADLSPCAPSHRTRDPQQEGEGKEENEVDGACEEEEEEEDIGEDEEMEDQDFDDAFHTPSKTLAANMAAASAGQASCRAAPQPSVADPFMTPGMSVRQWAEAASSVKPAGGYPGAAAAHNPAHDITPISRPSEASAPSHAAPAADGATPCSHAAVGSSAAAGPSSQAQCDRSVTSSQRDSDRDCDQGAQLQGSAAGAANACHGSANSAAANQGSTHAPQRTGAGRALPLAGAGASGRQAAATHAPIALKASQSAPHQHHQRAPPAGARPQHNNGTNGAHHVTLGGQRSVSAGGGHASGTAAAGAGRNHTVSAGGASHSEQVVARLGTSRSARHPAAEQQQPQAVVREASGSDAGAGADALHGKDQAAHGEPGDGHGESKAGVKGRIPRGNKPGGVLGSTMGSLAPKGGAHGPPAAQASVKTAAAKGPVRPGQMMGWKR
ncbi:hypothetical protein HYH02_008618 [Chlamydomonas schloesseri]|uniref:Uncharacterized protein n=1 Tax=Chlamydomonas schloesseri TaxID=2026947 RepID=A0A835WCZ2_9CHLO|nr:hypothetical protein HYH02_008618 [Chlamydomonas schloesseri]|eukprot:KAG2445150.1 hypothetical protein HYH02_008618 [Chlamydomonas schloesseri]